MVQDQIITLLPELNEYAQTDGGFRRKWILRVLVMSIGLPMIIIQVEAQLDGSECTQVLAVVVRLVDSMIVPWVNILGLPSRLQLPVRGMRISILLVLRGPSVLTGISRTVSVFVVSRTNLPVIGLSLLKSQAKYP